MRMQWPKNGTIYKILTRLVNTECTGKRLVRNWLFQNLLEPPTGTGTSQGETTAAKWPFFDAMHEWASLRHTIQPPYLMSSEEYEQPRNEE